MGKKSARVAKLIEDCRGRGLDAHYLAYFECFNRGLYYEAHDVLEQLWLPERGGPNGAFYKGLIQLAGAFVHLQKNRAQPAVSLLKLAAANLGKYSSLHERLDLREVRALIGDWLGRLEPGGFTGNPLSAGDAPQLLLREL
jgi:predicted metal-dependent hydrolase